MNSVKAVLFSILIPLLLAGQAMGAIFTWSAAVNTDTSNASQISTTGTSVLAVDLNSAFSSSNYIVNGVTFTASNANMSMGKDGSGQFGTAPGSTTYSSILNGGAYIAPDSDSPSHPIQLSGLIAGHSYQVQLWTPYWNFNYATRFSDTAPTSASSYLHAANESPSLNVGYTGGSIVSQYIVGTFTADSTSQSIYYYGDGGAGLIGAIQVRDVSPAGVNLTDTQIGTGTGGLVKTGASSFTLTGTGVSIWNNGSDSAHFAYTTATGDVEIVAHLVSFSYPVNQSEAGVMIRQSNSPSEVNRAATWYWPGVNHGGTLYNDLAWLGWGPTLAGNANYYQDYNYISKGINPPYWLKLVRVGNNFGAYWSLDGRDWNLIWGTTGGALFGTGAMNVGLFVNTNGSSTPATAAFDNVYVGPPRLAYKTSWVGDTSGGNADGYASSNIFALWVKSDGTCYANGTWDEAGQSVKAYKDGKVAFNLTINVPGVSDSGLAEGTVTGNANNLFLATNNGGSKVYRTDFNGNNPVVLPLPGLGTVGGMAASTDRLFVSDTTNNTVRIVDLTANPPVETTAAVTAGIIAHPGPIACDGTNFWITDCGSPFPLTNYVTTQSTYTPAIKCFNAAGVYQNRSITGVSNPTALAYQDVNSPPNGLTSDDRLWICENGAAQNIRYYTGLTGTPTFAGTFGQDKGLWQTAASPTPHPGQIYDSALGGDQRFYGPTGVGFDGSGNIYVACNGTNTGGTDLRKFNGTSSSSTMVWRQLGLMGVASGDFDPATGDIYTTRYRFTMNYANTAPGSEWSYTAFTRNPFLTGDPRNDPNVSTQGLQVRRLAGGNVFMYTTAMGVAPPCYFYRFNNQAGGTSQGTTATPYGSLIENSGGFKLWIDANADGIEQSPGEDTQVANTFGNYSSYDVDSNGNMWLVLMQGNGHGSPPSVIGQLPCASPTPIPAPPATQVATIPAYNAPGYRNYLCPRQIQSLKSIKYDYANDVMYCIGQVAISSDQSLNSGQWVLARYDNWRNSPTPDDHSPRYVTPLPNNATDMTPLAPPSVMMNYMGMAFAGDKLFIADLWGPIRVYDANQGNFLLTLNPGPELSASTAWEDMMMGINAFKRSTGEYLVTESDDGLHGNLLLYRWTPTADTTLPGAVTSLAASSQGHAIALTWTGPAGTVTSYNIYRGTASGSLTLYQSNVSGGSFTDTNVTPATTYYYTVAAVSGVGTGTQSNQASAAPAGAQAEFVKYDTTTQGNWNPTGGPKVYGSDGYCIPGPGSSDFTDLVSLPSTYVSSLTHTDIDPTRYTYISPNTDAGTSSTEPRFLQKPSGSGRTSAYYFDASGKYSQIHEITISDNNWHQVSIYLLSWTTHVAFQTVDILDKTTDAVLDSRQPMDCIDGKWVVWKVKGSVKIRITIGSNWPTLSGIFFDPVGTTATPTLGWWKLDDTSGTLATDSSGAGNNATKTGGTWTAGAHSSPAPGFNGCVTFGGTNATSNLAFTSFNSVNATKLTYATWFKTATSGVILGMWNAGPTTFAPILYVGTDNKLHGAFYTGAIQNMVSATPVSDNVWHHAALTSDGTVQTLYLDGAVVGMLSAPVSLISSASYSIAGGQGYVTGWPNLTGTQAYFNGLVDDMRLYNRVLSNSEIWKLYQP